MVIYDGYRYSKNEVDSSLIMYPCTMAESRSCKANICMEEDGIVEINNRHNHPPSSKIFNVEKRACKMNDECKKEPRA